MESTSLQRRALERIDQLRTELSGINSEIHRYPEIAYQEVKACALLREYLAQRGFRVTDYLGGVETAFGAAFGEKRRGPVVAFIAEYDALPGVGHGCGHNLIATGAVGAALGAAEAVKHGGLEGEVRVVGTPAEEYTEGRTGKLLLLDSGIFQDVDVCFMFHPWVETLAVANDLAFSILDVTFHGKTAHAAADPWNGRNALDGLVLTYMGISLLRQQVRSDARIHMILPEAGSAVNIIPDHARGRIMFRSPNLAYLEEMHRKIARCIEGAATTSETDAETQELTRIENTKFNGVLFEIASRNLKQLGLELKKPGVLFISGDFGNVSHQVPSFSFLVKTHDGGIPWHSTQVRDGAVLPQALEGMMFAAKVMAMSAIDILTEPACLTRIRNAFQNTST